VRAKPHDIFADVRMMSDPHNCAECGHSEDRRRDVTGKERIDDHRRVSAGLGQICWHFALETDSLKLALN
jgi:hypothetical protein